jgi:hypothetical protein
MKYNPTTQSEVSNTILQTLGYAYLLDEILPLIKQ